LGIAERGGGHVEVKSEANRGATFRVYLPRFKGPSAAPFAPPSVSAPGGGNETILLAEDESGIRAMTRAYLETLGYSVIEASDGTEAIRRSLEYVGPIHLVLTDVLMPGIRGDSAVKSIRMHRPDIKAMFMSGYADQDLIAHPESILYKPFEFPELGRRVRAVLDKDAAQGGDRLDPAAD
jgi:CheY-like chemotaxis protein